MMKTVDRRLLWTGMGLLFLVGAGNGCMGTQTFGIAARAGDTIVLAIGRYDNVQRDNMTVTITDSVGAVTTYGPNNSGVRAVVQLYPDPATYLLYRDRLYPGQAGMIGTLTSLSGGDKEWWETSVYIDLPSTMALGTANINVSTTTGLSVGPIAVDVLPGTGSSNEFWSNSTITGPISLQSVLSMLERLPHATVVFDGATVPYGIQISLTHTNSIDGTGKNLAMAIVPRADQSTLNWADNGTTLKVLLQAPSNLLPEKTKNYKFYVLGVDKTSLLTVPGSIVAVDVNGNPVAGVTASIQ